MLEEIKEIDYNLNISCCVDMDVEEEPVDLEVLQVRLSGIKLQSLCKDNLDF